MVMILPAAAELFAEKGPKSTSIREIAKHAGVNHGLVFRYFGTKEELLGATLDYLAAATMASYRSGANPSEILAAANRHLVVVVRSSLDGYSVAKLQSSFPGVSDIVAQVARTFPEDEADTARLAAAHAIVLHLGWQFFGPMLREIIDLNNFDDKAIVRSVVGEITRMVRSPAEPADPTNFPGGPPFKQ